MKIPRVIVLISAMRSYGQGLLKGIIKYSRLHGPWMFFNEPEQPEKILEVLKSWSATGMIVRSDEAEEFKNFLPDDIPRIVLAGSNMVPGYCNIIGDWQATGTMAAEHLLERGYRRFAYCSYKESVYSIERGKNFYNRIKKAGFSGNFYEYEMARSLRLFGDSQNRIIDWLKSLPKPISVMACNDDYARHVLWACKEAGLYVPGEVAVIGVDNDEISCGLAYPTLSSVSLNTERAGYEAAQMLDRMMKGDQIRQQTIVVRPKHVAARQSTDIFAIEDPEVANAVRFIYEHAREMLQVGDVVENSCLSLRSLQQRFKNVLGRTISQEIRRIRVDMICRLLLDSNMSILNIAMSCGFPGVAHISRYFRQEKNMSLLEYRKKYGNK